MENSTGHISVLISKHLLKFSVYSGKLFCLKFLKLFEHFPSVLDNWQSYLIYRICVFQILLSFSFWLIYFHVGSNIPMRFVEWSFQGGYTPRKRYWNTILQIPNSCIQISSCTACRSYNNLTTCQRSERMLLKEKYKVIFWENICFHCLVGVHPS